MSKQFVSLLRVPSSQGCNPGRSFPSQCARSLFDHLGLSSMCSRCVLTSKMFSTLGQPLSTQRSVSESDRVFWWQMCQQDLLLENLSQLFLILFSIGHHRGGGVGVIAITLWEEGGLRECPLVVVILEQKIMRIAIDFKSSNSGEGYKFPLLMTNSLQILVRTVSLSSLSCFHQVDWLSCEVFSSTDEEPCMAGSFHMTTMQLSFHIL